MTATNKIDAIGWLRKQLEQAPDPFREAPVRNRFTPNSRKGDHQGSVFVGTTVGP